MAQLVQKSHMFTTRTRFWLVSCSARELKSCRHIGTSALTMLLHLPRVWNVIEAVIHSWTIKTHSHQPKFKKNDVCVDTCWGVPRIRFHFRFRVVFMAYLHWTKLTRKWHGYMKGITVMSFNNIDNNHRKKSLWRPLVISVTRLYPV